MTSDGVQANNGKKYSTGKMKNLINSLSSLQFFRSRADSFKNRALLSWYYNISESIILPR